MEGPAQPKPKKKGNIGRQRPVMRSVHDRMLDDL